MTILSLKKMKIEEVLLSSDVMKPEVLNRLKQLARTHGFAIRRFETCLEEVPLEIQRPHPLQSPPVLVSEAERNPETIRT